jgi:hypothetical protein
MSDQLPRSEAGAAAENPTGEVPSLVDGNESDQELRKLITEHVWQCSQGEIHSHCPFRILSGLSSDSLTTLIKTMNRNVCLSLFEMERKYRATGVSKCPVASKQAE